jgi:hypothetical protein
VPIVVNGFTLGVERNGVFTPSNTATIPGGRLWTEAAVAYNDMRSAALADGIAGPEFMPTGRRSSARTFLEQQALWDSQPPTAAPPGTSNHGWGLAVDLAGPRAQEWVKAHGLRWRFSWDEGKRVGENWHFRYVGGYKPDRLKHLTKRERKWVREYDRLRRENRDLARRRILRRRMAEQRKAIWRAANRPVALGGGWGIMRRRARYESLKSRTT